MFAKSLKTRNEHMQIVTKLVYFVLLNTTKWTSLLNFPSIFLILYQYSWDQFLPTLDAKNMILAPFCERKECEEKIKADSTKEFVS